MNVLALGELDVAHARVAQRQSEAVETASAPVAEVAPVHLALLARAGLEAHEGSFAPFLPPRQHRQFQLGVAAPISADAKFVQQFAGVVYAGFPPFPQEGAVRIDLARRRVFPFVGLRPLQQMLAHGLAVEVELLGDGRHTPPLLLQIAYVHKILQVEHGAPWSAQRFHTWGFFDRRYWGIFNRRYWGILDRR